MISLRLVRNRIPRQVSRTTVQRRWLSEKPTSSTTSTTTTTTEKAAETVADKGGVQHHYQPHHRAPQAAHPRPNYQYHPRPPRPVDPRAKVFLFLAGTGAAVGTISTIVLFEQMKRAPPSMDKTTSV